MNDTDDVHDTDPTGSDAIDGPTRRDAIKCGGSVALGGLLAGCTGGDPTADTGETAEDGSSPASDATDGEPDDDADGSAETEGDGAGHAATLSPMGTVEFDSVPERVFTVFTGYADMAVALGHGDAVTAVYVPEMSGTTMNRYYGDLEGVSFEWEDLFDPLSEGLAKERLYDLDADVHLADPAWASTQENWDRSDVEEIDSRVAPWFGNFYSGTRAAPPSGYDDYEYYDLWEVFGGVADVFDERERYEALAAVHEDLLEMIRSDLPPNEERPTAVRVSLAADGESFYTYHLNEPGYWLADTRPLGAVDAFAEEEWGGLWGEVDFEAMAEADPDVILHLWGFTPSRSMAEFRSTLRDHPVGADLAAVRNDRLHAQGMRYQGPIMNLFQIEMTAKQLYPETFGEWPRYEDGDGYPEFSETERLFDRERVANAIAGDP
ncbi:MULTISPECIES: ABC transporter substrate-binding protein [Haloferacaceae]|uniref:ABC transporter substrate-binding protein n=1 Tax=Halorubrum glutamatedens TaxID=2707018 RepID=A0ABD5QWK6_9EURY|nr:ABC transporter substrate-binding protein [Halobellus captivus]